MKGKNNVRGDFHIITPPLSSHPHPISKQGSHKNLLFLQVCFGGVNLCGMSLGGESLGGDESLGGESLGGESLAQIEDTQFSSPLPETQECLLQLGS